MNWRRFKDEKPRRNQLCFAGTVAGKAVGVYRGAPDVEGGFFRVDAPVYSQDVDLDSLTHWLPIDALDIPPPTRPVPEVPEGYSARWVGQKLAVSWGEDYCIYEVTPDVIRQHGDRVVPMWVAKLAAKLEWD
ncbi:MAG: hypothetical protein ACYTBJ_23430 [Planctomycetota bacterium]